MASSSVKLYVYDLSNGLARQLSKQVTGRQIDGIWHTSVVVFGREFFYGQGIDITPPGRSHHGNPLQILDMGETFIDQDTFNEYIEEMREHYTPEKYHLLDFNCNSFTNDAVGFLTGQSIPSFIRDLPTDFLSTPFGIALRPTIDAMYRRPSVGVTPRTAPLPIPSSDGSADPQLTASILQAVAAQVSANRTPGNAGMHATESLSGPVHVITNPASFRSFLNTNKAAVAFFTSATCGPCKMIEPLFIRLAEEKGLKSQSPSPKGAAFAKIDIGVGQGQKLAAEWRITATPTFVFFLNGNKIQEVKGADSGELQSQVNLLLFQAYPPHPHTKLSLPVIERTSLAPILFTQVPSVDAVITKLDSCMDSFTWPSQAAYGKAEVKVIINDNIAPYLRARLAKGKVTERPAAPAMLTSWSQASTILINSAPVENLFPVVDLWRLLVLDPGTWAASQPGFDMHPLSLLLAIPLRQKAPCPRNYLLTLLRLFSNVFASPSIARHFVVGAQKQKLTELVVQTLLHDDALVKNASASLLFNLAAVIQNNRVKSVRGEQIQSAEWIVTDESEDWEVEMISVIVEALRRDKDNEEFVHRLTAALAFIVRLSPFCDSLQTLLQVLQCREVLERKISGGEWRKSDAKKLVKEVADFVSHCA